MRISKKLVVISAIVVVILAAGAVGAYTYWQHMLDKPEAVLYLALGQDALPYDLVSPQVVEGEGAKGKFNSILTKDGIHKASGKLDCTSSVPDYGDLRVVTSILQIQEQIFFRTDEVVFSGGPDKKINKDLNDYYTKTAVDKWVLISSPDDAFLGYKERGVIFGLLGASSKRVSGRDIVAKLKENKVVTILNAQPTASNGSPSVEYSLLIRRSAYDKFIDSVEPNFKYKSGVLDQLFLDDTEELTVVINKKDLTISSFSATVPNLCATLISEFDPESARDLSSTLDVRSSDSANSDIKNLVKPSKYLTEVEYDKLFEDETAQ